MMKEEIDMAEVELRTTPISIRKAREVQYRFEFALEKNDVAPLSQEDFDTCVEALNKFHKAQEIMRVAYDKSRGR